VKTDFHADWIEMLRQELVAAGYPTLPGAAPEDVRTRYFNLEHRMVAPHPRQVLEADTLAIPPKHQSEIEAIREKIETGVGLTPHMSRRLTDPDYNDMLLNDWDIQHFHLSTAVQSDGFVTRTSDLLFAYFSSDSAHLITIRPHGTWTEVEMLETVLRNWPHLLTQRCLESVVAAKPPFTDAERQTLRRKGVSTAVTLSDGRVYLGLGRGYVSTGLSLRVKRNMSWFSRVIRDAQKWVEDNLALLRGQAPVPLPEQPSFRLLKVNFDDDGTVGFRIQETQTGSAFDIPKALKVMP
jgi:hypothetical protein